MRVHQNLAGPGPCPMVILPQSTPAAFAYCVNPSSSISSFTTLLLFLWTLHPLSPLQHFTFSNVSSCTSLLLWARSLHLPPPSPILSVAPLLPDVPRSHWTSPTLVLSHLPLALPADVSLSSAPPSLVLSCSNSAPHPSSVRPHALSLCPTRSSRSSHWRLPRFLWSGAIPNSLPLSI